MIAFVVSQYDYEDIALFQSTHSTDYTSADDILSSVPMDIDMEVSTSCSLTSLEANTENKLQDKRFSRAERVDLETFLETEVEPTDPFKPFGEDLQTNGEQIKVPEMAPLEDEILGEASAEKIEDSRFSPEEWVDLEMFCGTGEEPADDVKQSPGDHKIDGEQMKVLELAQSENKNYHV
ncbi:sister chromatid cohesion 1 protein 2-like [Fagus crenata]